MLKNPLNNMKSVLPDTNFFLRYLLDDVPSQVKIAEKLFTDAKNDKIKLRVPQIIIFEIHFALIKYYLFPKNEVLDKLENVVSTDYFLIEDRDVFLKAIDIHREKNISFVDSFLKALCESKNFKLLSFDKKL